MNSTTLKILFWSIVYEVCCLLVPILFKYKAYDSYGKPKGFFKIGCMIRKYRGEVCIKLTRLEFKQRQFAVRKSYDSQRNSNKFDW